MIDCSQVLDLHRTLALERRQTPCFGRVRAVTLLQLRHLVLEPLTLALGLLLSHGGGGACSEQLLPDTLQLELERELLLRWVYTPRRCWRFVQ